MFHWKNASHSANVSGSTESHEVKIDGILLLSNEKSDQILYLKSLKIIQEYHCAKARHRWGTSTSFFLPKFIILVANPNQ